MTIRQLVLKSVVYKCEQTNKVTLTVVLFFG